MSALFPRWANSAFRLVLAMAGLLAVGLLGGLMLYVRMPYNTGQQRAVDQPVQFDHRHHVRDDGIRCLFCHSTAETTPYAGVPTAAVCMGCHNQVWSESPLLEPVRRSYFSGKPIRWRRVHALADFVYFDHSVHVRNGVDCVDCHGRVDQMPRVYRVAPLQMQWCLDCHRNPRATLARSAQGTRLGTVDGTSSGALDESIEDGRRITRLTTCTACHR